MSSKMHNQIPFDKHGFARNSQMAHQIMFYHVSKEVSFFRLGVDAVLQYWESLLKKVSVYGKIRAIGRI
jgi:hypothetical protein